MEKKRRCLTIRSVSVEVDAGTCITDAHLEAAKLAAELGIGWVDYKFNGQDYTAYAYEHEPEAETVDEPG